MLFLSLIHIYEGRAGASALWLSTLDEKREAGEILYDLQIMEDVYKRQDYNYNDSDV